MHHNNDIDAGTRHAQKPEIITFYNATKGGVDTVDEMCETPLLVKVTVGL